MIIYIVKEVSILDSGERSFHATPFKKEEDAINEMHRVSDELMAEDGYRPTCKEELRVELKDEDSNIYEITVERNTLL